MVRKNAATLTADERQRFINALLTLKRTVEPGHTLSTYDEFVAIHLGVTQLVNGPASGIDGGHGGPAFLAWHREYILRFEQALQSVDSTVSLPYWNWTYGTNSDTSLLFQDNFMGPAGSGGTNGREIATGYFVANPNTQNPDGWRVPTELHPFVPSTLRTAGLQRNSSLNPTSLPSVATMDNAMNATRYSQFRPNLEGPHGSVHVWVGGHMGRMISPIDPIFFLHHSNVDRVWAIWQLTHSGSSNYNPTNAGGYGHRIDDRMWPWDSGQSSPANPLQSLLPNIPATDIKTPRDTLDISTLGYSYDNMSTGGGGSEPTPSRCFIATAAYGSELAPPVQFLRNFRDEVVLQSKFQKPFENILDVYYKFSPPVANQMRKNKTIKYAMKYSVVWPFVALARATAFSIQPFLKKEKLKKE